LEDFLRAKLDEDSDFAKKNLNFWFNELKKINYTLLFEVVWGGLII